MLRHHRTHRWGLSTWFLTIVLGFASVAIAGLRPITTEPGPNHLDTSHSTGVEETVDQPLPEISQPATADDQDESKGKIEKNKTILDVGLQDLTNSISGVKQANQRVKSANNIRQLVIGLHKYHDKYDKFPAAAIRHESGKLYSWRVAILPFIKCREIYDNYHFDEDWNSEHNLSVTAEMPELFCHPSVNEGTSTSFFAITGRETVFNGDSDVNFKDVTDGIYATAMLVEAKSDVYWTKPQDITVQDATAMKTLGGFTKRGFNVAMVDGSVRFLSHKTDPKLWQTMLTISAGDEIEK